jgi:hypothetical protein
MRIGTFVIGGLAGAAIVMMIQRNQMMSAVTAGLGHSLKKRMSGMKEDAIEKASNIKFASSFKRSSENERSSRNSSSSDRGGLDQIEKLVAQDAEVSKEINSIMEQNGKHRI